MSDYFRTDRRETLAVLSELVNEKALSPVEVDGWKEPALVHPDNMKLVKAATRGKIKAEMTTLLSPFDPLVWDRARASFMLDFEYKIECYTPAPLRRYGYFTLPILRRGALVGRLDAKAHRKEGIFEIKTLHLEPGVRVDDEMINDITEAS